MAVPVDSAFYVQPNTISDLTLWKDGVQQYITQEISGDYIHCDYSGQPGTGTLKATGYEDAEVELYDGYTSYVTMTPVEPEINYVSNLSDGTNTYVIMDEGAQRASNLVTSVSASSTDSQYPSAKLFYDTVGDIVTLINAL